MGARCRKCQYPQYKSISSVPGVPHVYDTSISEVQRYNLLTAADEKMDVALSYPAG